MKKPRPKPGLFWVRDFKVVRIGLGGGVLEVLLLRHEGLRREGLLESGVGEEGSVTFAALSVPCDVAFAKGVWVGDDVAVRVEGH